MTADLVVGVLECGGEEGDGVDLELSFRVVAQLDAVSRGVRLVRGDEQQGLEDRLESVAEDPMNENWRRVEEKDRKKDVSGTSAVVMFVPPAYTAMSTKITTRPYTMSDTLLSTELNECQSVSSRLSCFRSAANAAMASTKSWRRRRRPSKAAGLKRVRGFLMVSGLRKGFSFVRCSPSLDLTPDRGLDASPSSLASPSMTDFLDAGRQRYIARHAACTVRKALNCARPALPS